MQRTVSMPPSIRAVVPWHELGTPGPLALTEESTVTTKCWPRDIRSVLGWKPLPSRTAKMTGAPETGAGKPLGQGDDGLAGAALDDGMLAPAPAAALCWAALPQAHSAPVSASPISAAMTGIRFSMTAPPCRETDALWTRHPLAWFPSVAARSQTARFTRTLAPFPGRAGRSAGILAAAANGCAATIVTTPVHADSGHSLIGQSCSARPSWVATTLADVSPVPLVTVPTQATTRITIRCPADGVGRGPGPAPAGRAGVTDWLEPVVLPDVQQLPSRACGLDLRLRGNLARYRHGAGSG